MAVGFSYTSKSIYISTISGCLLRIFLESVAQLTVFYRFFEERNRRPKELAGIRPRTAAGLLFPPRRLAAASVSPLYINRPIR